MDGGIFSQSKSSDSFCFFNSSEKAESDVARNLSIHFCLLKDWNILSMGTLVTFWLHPGRAIIFYAFLRLRLNPPWAETWLSIVWKTQVFLCITKGFNGNCIKIASFLL